MFETARIAIVVPAFKCQRHISDVLQGIPSWVDQVYVVDDQCPEKTGDFVELLKINRVMVLRHPKNRGVGAAMITGYQQALTDNYDIVVKVDGDNQMDLSLLPHLISPLIEGEADYSKGNRFYYPKSLKAMPKTRLWGNAFLSLMTKISSGYYHVFDPTNGFTAIHRTALSIVELDKLSERFFFETDLLFRLNIIRAVVVDVPMIPIYNDEESNLSPLKIVPTFLLGHIKNFTKRFIYSHILRNFSVASINFASALFLITFGTLWSGYHWFISNHTHVPATTGTVMIGAISLIIGFQSFTQFFVFDMADQPRVSLQKKFKARKAPTSPVIGLS